jgi:hypothetical protein
MDDIDKTVAALLEALKFSPHCAGDEDRQNASDSYR